MSGAGSATVAWAEESSYNSGLVGSPTYRLPGANTTVETAEMTRNLAESLVPDDPEAQDLIAQQFDGQLSVSFVVTDDQFHRLVFNDSNTGFTNGTVTSAEWFLGVDHLSGTTERQIQGWVCESAEISYNGTTDLVRATLSGPYAEEDKNTAITPGTVSDNVGGNEVPGHGATFKINSSRVGKLQSGTVSFSQLARLIFDSNSPIATDAVNGNVQQSVDLTAVFDDRQRLELALGSASATSTEDFVDSKSATVSFDHDGNKKADYSFTDVKPESYSWQDLVNPESDLTEAVTLRAFGVTGSSP